MNALTKEQQQGENSSSTYLLEQVDLNLDVYSLEKKIQSELIVNLQSVCRSYLIRKSFKNLFENNFVKLFLNEKVRPKNIDLLKYGLLIVQNKEYNNNFEYLIPLCQNITNSLSSASKLESFAALFLSVDYMKRSTSLISRLVLLLLPILEQLDLNKIMSVKLVNCVAKFLCEFICSSTWKFVNASASILPILETLCTKITTSLMIEESVIIMFSRIIYDGLKEKKTILSFNVVDMLFTVVLRIFKKHKIISKNEEADETLKTKLFCLNFIKCPALIFSLSNKTCNELKTQKYFEKSISWFVQNQQILCNLNGTDKLNILANFIHLSYLEYEVLLENLYEWTTIINSFFMHCQKVLVKPDCGKQRRNVNNWHHPIFGWTSERIDEGTQGTFARLSIQLSYLWSHRIVECLFGKVLDLFKTKKGKELTTNSTINTNFLSDGPLSVELIQKVLNKFSLRNQTLETQTKILPPVSMTAIVCQLYQNALITFTNTQIDILSGLCRDDKILFKLWNFVNNEDLSGNSNGGGIHTFILLLNADSSVSNAYFSPLHLFADTAYSLISILDEKEMYESDHPFSLTQLREIARFANLFCFKVIWEGIIDLNERRPHALFQSLYQLCLILYNRDCRRSFTFPIKDFWIVPEASAKRTQIIAEFERHQNRAQLLMIKIPHVVPLRDRMLLFRKFVIKHKEGLSRGGSLPTTVITIERTRIVEDGYRQLSNLSSEALCGTIRVKFINQQGLDEAGIDQDGVFKEFLELTLKKVFNPELNLFKTTSDRLLYPSSTSFVHENHLSLFQFVGRMLAKLVYEGICVDIQLAPVLLATVLGKQLCPFDELATLDPVLYNNLTYVKHYNDSDDVRDLALTFSHNEEFLGKIRTSELIVGGQDIEVNNENKIMYIHKMAQFRVIKQTKEQCQHFVAGFRSIINPKWLSLFSTHELQYLISGHTSDIDLEDLKKHTQYYGGFHSNHRVVKWLWNILQFDFNFNERQLFLKFVTSCSRAPLLGFQYLEPPFSIRCVETPDDMDQGDTLGSIVRGFLAIKRKQPMTRLPTASTCFNLLKLPNYSKKSILLDKLRYAIHAETGFELS